MKGKGAGEICIPCDVPAIARINPVYEAMVAIVMADHPWRQETLERR